MPLWVVVQSLRDLSVQILNLSNVYSQIPIFCMLCSFMASLSFYDFSYKYTAIFIMVKDDVLKSWIHLIELKKGTSLFSCEPSDLCIHFFISIFVLYCIVLFLYATVRERETWGREGFDLFIFVYRVIDFYNCNTKTYWDCNLRIWFHYLTVLLTKFFQTVP